MDIIKKLAEELVKLTVLEVSHNIISLFKSELVRNYFCSKIASNLTLRHVECEWDERNLSVVEFESGELAVFPVKLESE